MPKLAGQQPNKQDMLTEENNWNIEVIKRRFQNEYEIDISFEQATLIYNQESSVGSVINHFSTWERVDFELSYLKEILDNSQLIKFSNQKNGEIEHFENWLVEQDKNISTQINVVKEMLVYYNEKLLPTLFADYTLLLFGDFQRSKINYIKAEYKLYLDKRKKEIYLSHIQDSRAFQPNLLILSLLSHQLNCLFPDYYSFREYMDESTKCIKNYLIEKLKYHSYTIDVKVKTILPELKAFNVELGKKHYGKEGVSGWHSDNTHSEEQEKEYRLMCMVLLDRNKYGC